MAQKKESTMASDVIDTILGPDSTFEGKLVFEGGKVRIDGKFKGEIVTESTVFVGEPARVEGTINVGNIVITGEVIGDIIAKHSVSIEKPGRVRGTITTPELMIEKGVIFEGTCKMENFGKGGQLLKDKPQGDNNAGNKKP